MTGYRVLTCAVGAALVLACNSPRGEEGAPEVAGGSVAASSMQELVEGYYVFGNEVNTFSPCASSDTYWVVGDSARMDSLRAAYLEWFTESQAEPYAPMFGRFRGDISDGPLDGFAEAYDGLFRVESVALLRGLEEGDCEPMG